MNTNKVYVNNKGVGREKALSEVEKMSDYLNLPRKNRLHLRLLAEEMLGMAAEIGNDFDADFWAEREGNTCRLYLDAEINKMSYEKRESLINVSTNKKNAAVTGIMGKLKEIMELYWVGYIDTASDTNGLDFLRNAGKSETVMSSAYTGEGWKLSTYRNTIEGRKDTDRYEEWDELEKSIVANIADDISVGIKGGSAEFIITKSFK